MPFRSILGKQENCGNAYGIDIAAHHMRKKR